MHELMIFFGTMGGIFIFGMVGMIVGPIIAALFVTIWEIYGQAFADILPDTGYVLRKRREAAEGEGGGETEPMPDIDSAMAGGILIPGLRGNKSQ